jgi:hypothetical protein
MNGRTNKSSRYFNRCEFSRHPKWGRSALGSPRTAGRSRHGRRTGTIFDGEALAGRELVARMPKDAPVNPFSVVERTFEFSILSNPSTIKMGKDGQEFSHQLQFI